MVQASVRPTHPRLSVVIPCLDEADVLRATWARLDDVLGQRKDLDLEVVFVDDGSGDGTDDVIRALHEADDRVLGVFLSRTFGQQRATSAGLRFATGDCVVVMDADLQDPPEVVLPMLAAWRNGADVAYGQRHRRAGEPLWKKATASAFYRLLDRVAEVEVPLDTGDFRLMDRVVVDALLALPEQDRFLRGLVAWLGFTAVAVPFDRAPRAAGHSKYAWRHALALAIDGLIGFAPSPLPLLAGLGVGCVLLALPAVGVAAWQASVGWLVLAAVLALGGVQLVALGVLAEYASRALREARRRPAFVVREVLGVAPAVARDATTGARGMVAWRAPAEERR